MRSEATYPRAPPQAGGEVAAGTPEQFSRHLGEEMARCAKVIKASDMPAE
ncbi:hypothetical protein L541_1991 [Bordetella hinzii CA90 BAL1384]|nr:hypothetical protein [Bordetella hinzii]KCB32719.1 hypothetical protein L541_1991 [Bordetella hinzii CA90 BAL1384]QWF39084.1 hypothetical protein HHA25_12700 [Bordetella hinzii]QWF43630.1 hypothetical protein HHA24_12695 [Bordetella hinzii]QWF48168.1 hypothetical protein HHA23_12695 [Bordetella hinzii]QWF52705.1 hypothetical protein HHA22_12700 [Bordetella hinzii]